MDAQIVKVQLKVAIIIFGIIGTVNAVINKDLVLTPKEGLQVHGKTIFYEEPLELQQGSLSRNQSSLASWESGAWEQTLKHVTYVTLNAGAAAQAVSGTLSKLKDYTDFLQTPYIRQEGHNHARFGDIITLAQGRLVDLKANGALRFVEGSCDYACDNENVIAVWQVQKIRHRDPHRKFRYEMKFSVSPLQGLVGEYNNNSDDRETSASGSRKNAFKSFILKDEDYPRSFERLNFEQEAVSQRRSDNFGLRNFRRAVDFHDHVGQNFNAIRSNFKDVSRRNLPLALPQSHAAEKLNIGEYIQDFPKATDKMGSFPSPNHRLFSSTATTYRPNYHINFARPEKFETHHQQQQIKFPHAEQETLPEGKHIPIVTHHYHHHYFMQSTDNSPPHPPLHNQNFYRDENVDSGFSPNFFTTEPQQDTTKRKIPPRTSALQELTFSNERKERTKQLYTPTAQLYHMYPIRIGPELPLLVYPPVPDPHETPSRNKPFVQSEPADEQELRYSEPDPLYENMRNSQSDPEVYEADNPQMESPISLLQHDAFQHGEKTVAARNKKPDSITAQLPPTDFYQDVRIPYVDEDENTNNNEDQPISTEKSTMAAARTEPTPSATTTSAASINTTTTTLETHNTTSIILPTETTTYPLKNSHVTIKKFIITTTSTETPLPSVSKFTVHKTRAKYLRTTTEEPVLKWKPKRKSNFTIMQRNHLTPLSHHDDNTTNQSNLQEQVETTTPANDIRTAQERNETVEVLTQKSVSKSVSIKVGNQLKEIPVNNEDHKGLNIDAKNDGFIGVENPKTK